MPKGITYSIRNGEGELIANIYGSLGTLSRRLTTQSASRHMQRLTSEFAIGKIWSLHCGLLADGCSSNGQRLDGPTPFLLLGLWLIVI